MIGKELLRALDAVINDKTIPSNLRYHAAVLRDDTAVLCDQLQVFLNRLIEHTKK